MVAILFLLTGHWARYYPTGVQTHSVGRDRQGKKLKQSVIILCQHRILMSIRMHLVKVKILIQ